MMVKRNAFYITDSIEVVGGWHLTGTALPLKLQDSIFEEGVYYQDDGRKVHISAIQSTSKLGDLQRIREESLHEYLFFITNENYHKKPPFWIFPATGIGTNEVTCEVEIEEFNFFGSAGFQAAAWARFMWGNIFFDDPSTPDSHISTALKEHLKLQDILPVKISGSDMGLLFLTKMIRPLSYEASIYTIENKHINVGDKLESFAELEIEGVSAHFASEIGTVTKIMQNVSQ